MARWEPNASERLSKAAMELFEKRGFDATTAADIAALAGLTERTFFRYFADKREVLFSGAAALRLLLVDSLQQAPADMAPLQAVVFALQAAAPMFESRSEFARKRQALISAHAELRERELNKMASLAGAFTEALKARGVTDADASLAAEMGIIVFSVAFQRWVDDTNGAGLVNHMRDVSGAMKTLTVVFE